jgi:hypothetical protein
MGCKDSSLVHIFLNTVSYCNWTVYNHRKDTEIAENLFLFSFAVPSTAKEIIFNFAAFASQAKRAVKQLKKTVIELANQSIY